MEEERKSHDQKMKKMEQEMEQVFEMKVKERNQRIIDSENDVSKSCGRLFIWNICQFFACILQGLMFCMKKFSRRMSLHLLLPVADI